MIIFLDESGDLGFDFENKNSSRFFVITLLACRNRNSMVMFDKAVKRTLKNKIHAKNCAINELKGTKTSFKIKKYFYTQISHQGDYTLHTIVLDKLKLKESLKNHSKHRLYNFMSAQIVSQVDLSHSDSILLIVDRSKKRKEIEIFNTYLKNYLEGFAPLNTVCDISHERSHEKPTLQAVDLFCWGVFRYFEYGDKEWFSVYEHKMAVHFVSEDIKKDGP